MDVLDKFHRRVSHWTHRWLSSAGHVVLLKFVVQSLPIYRCFVQVTHVKFVRELHALTHQFLWADNLLYSKWSLVKWEFFCRPKQEGGLVLKSTSLMGQALAAKLY